MVWEPVFGLEVHVQLRTRSKIFSGASTAFGAEPNTQACAIDLGLPGVLPVLNKAAVHLAIRLGLSIHATIAAYSVFARKNYFYPDLPKGYQISQYELPIVHNGYLDIETEQGSTKRIGIIRAHLEEDAGKSIHEGMEGCSGIDLNRAGTPLLEIVSAPEMASAKEAVAYLKTLHTLVRYLNVSDANMQEGSFRCDVNVSLRPKGDKKFGTRTEIKNINSFRFVERAILGEIERHTDILNSGGFIMQETRLYDANKDETRSMRSKEEAHDYRYFPDPDLLPLAINNELIEAINKELPELPTEKRNRFINQYGLNAYDANLLIANIDTAHYFESVINHTATITPKLAANWINGDLMAELNQHNLDITHSPVTATLLAGLLCRVADNTLSSSMAKAVFAAMWVGEGDADSIIEKRGLKQISDPRELEKIIDDVMAANPQQVSDFCAGKEKLMAFFVGQVMKATKGKANPQQLNELLIKKLKS